MVSVSDLYRLDGGKTLKDLTAMRDLLGGSFDPQYPYGWTDNPITRIVKDEYLWVEYTQRCSRISGSSVLFSQVICQQLLWHHGSEGKGPEGDGLSKSLRKHWYLGHKDTIQHISERLGVWRKADGSMNDASANGCMNGVYQKMVVNTRLVTYLDLFVEDDDRKFNVVPSYQRLPAPLDNILICVEKNAARKDCVLIGTALGVRVILSGKGKMGRAGTERVLRKAFSTHFETDTPGNLVTEESPLYLLTISDWDYDGEAVIAPAFRNQLERYIDPNLIQDVRVGVKPSQIGQMGYDTESKAYMVKNHVNRAYSSWCRNLGVYVYEEQVFTDLDSMWDNVPDWQQDTWLDAMIASLDSSKNQGKKNRREIEKIHGYIPSDYNVLAEYHAPLVALYEQIAPLGFELDALKRVEYADLIIEGLLQMVDWETFTEALSKKDWADPEVVTEAITQSILNDNEDYCSLSEHVGGIEQQVNELLDGLRRTALGFEEHVREKVAPLVMEWKDDKRISEDDDAPDQEEMSEHLKQLQVWDHWRPYSKEERNAKLQEIVEEEEAEALEELRLEGIEFEMVSLS